MSKRIVYRTGDVLVQYDSDMAEYRVHRRGGRPDEGYFTSDREDAISTAHVMQREYEDNPGAKMPQAFTYDDAERLYGVTVNARRTRASDGDLVPLGANTYISRLPQDENSVNITLYSTDIISWYPDGRIVLRTGGHNTVTTANRINAFLSPFITVFRKRGQMFARLRSGEELPFTMRHGTTLVIPADQLLRKNEEQRGGIHVDIHSHNPLPSRIDDAGHVHFSDEDYGVFQWREDNRYVVADSVFNSRSEKRAQRKADALNEQHPDLGVHGYVVRQLKYLRRV